MHGNSFDEDPTVPIPPSQHAQQNRQSVGAPNEASSNSHAPDPSVQPSRKQPYHYSPEEFPQPDVYPYPRQSHRQQPTEYQQGQAEQQALPIVPSLTQRPPHRRRGCLVASLIILVLVLLLGAFAITIGQRVLAFGSAISTQAPLTSQTNYLGTSDRVNLLVMGYGGGAHDGANLTDSMMVMSLLPQSRHTTLISVPRDLWVQIPPASGQYHKINTAYEFASNNGKDPAAGGNAAAQKISLVTGLDVKYWLTINFQGFRDLINSIGGIDVYVPDSFTAKYPANDNPAINPNFIKIHFSKGLQHMDGETAIRYARARYVYDNLAEGTDFARSARQQIIIKAALAKVKQVSTWPSLFNAMAALQHTIYTNLSLADLMQFSLKMDLNTAHRVGLSNQNILMDSVASDGEAILLPRNGNWQGIIDYVKQQLYN